MNPIRGYTVLNFIHWLAIHHPEIRTIRDTPTDQLLELANEFEQGKLSENEHLTQKWKAGFEYLLNDYGDWQGYDKARSALAQMETG